MAITVNATVDSFLFSDVPLPLTLTGSGFSAPYDKPLWESPHGDFSDAYSETPNFFADHRTQQATIIGRRAARMYNSAQNNWASISNITFTDANHGTATKSSGASNAWDAKAQGAIFAGDTNALIDFTTNENNLDKAAGLTDNAFSGDPTNINFKFAWWLRADGYAMPYKAGVTLLSTAVPYVAGDRFQIRRQGSLVYYYKNGEFIVSTSISGVGAYYPLIGFQDVGATIRSTFFNQTQDNTNFYDDFSFQVYGVIPEQPNWGYELAKDNITLSSVAEDGTKTLRVKNTAKRSYSLQYQERPFSEYLKISDFWDWHQKHIKFYYRDIVFDKLILCRFNTGLKLQPNGPDRVSMSLVIEEV